MKVQAVLFSFLLLLSLLVTAQATEAGPPNGNIFPLRLSIAHGPYELVIKAVTQFKKQVESRTKGHVRVSLNKIKKSPYQQVDQGANNQALRDLIVGDTEMAQIYTFNTGRFCNDFYALELPYIFENDEHVFKVLDGPVGKLLENELLENTGILRSLAFTYSGGFRIIPTDGIEINKAEDFAKLIIAMPANPITKAAFDSLKVKTHATLKRETLHGLGDKSINAFESTYPRFVNSGEKTYAPIVNETRMNVLISSFIINEKFFQKLPREYQDIIKEEAISAAKIERQESIQAGEKLRSDSKKLNFKVVTLPKEEIQKAKELTKKVYQKYESVFGKELIQQIRNP